MNLLDRIKSYLYFRKIGVSHDKAWLKMPLTNLDKALLIFIGLMIFLLTTLAYKNEIDDDNAFKTAQTANAYELMQKARCALKAAQIEANKSQLILVSALNGSFIENGKIKTVCILNAAGECE